MDLLSPFENDPFSLVMMAYDKLFPGKPYWAYYDQHTDDGECEHGEEYGYTHFVPNRVPEVHIFTEHSINTQVETFAHELAHVAAGVEHEHDEVWSDCFNKLFEEYNRLGQELFGDDDAEHEAEERTHNEVLSRLSEDTGINILRGVKRHDKHSDF